MSAGQDGIDTPPSSDDQSDTICSESSTSSSSSSSTSTDMLRQSSLDIIEELSSTFQELQNELHLAGCVSRTKTRMELILISSRNGKDAIGNTDHLFCVQILPLVVHVLFRRTTFPPSFTATQCNHVSCLSSDLFLLCGVAETCKQRCSFTPHLGES